jgi:hypothetical protein
MDQWYQKRSVKRQWTMKAMRDVKISSEKYE